MFFFSIYEVKQIFKNNGWMFIIKFRDPVQFLYFFHSFLPALALKTTEKSMEIVKDLQNIMVNIGLKEV